MKVYPSKCVGEAVKNESENPKSPPEPKGAWDGLFNQFPLNERHGCQRFPKANDRNKVIAHGPAWSWVGCGIGVELIAGLVRLEDPSVFD